MLFDLRLSRFILVLLFVLDRELLLRLSFVISLKFLDLRSLGHLNRMGNELDLDVVVVLSVFISVVTSRKLNVCELRSLS